MSMQSLRRALLGAALRARRRPAGRRAKRLSRQAGHADRALSCRRLHRPPPAHRGAGRIQYLGQPVIVENRPGAGGTLGPANMAKTAKPDGYTISLYTLAMLRMPYMHKTTGIRSTISPSHRPVGLYLRLHRARRFSVQNLQRLHRGRAQGPGSIDYGSTGAGSSPHLLMEEVARNAGVQLNHVPFKGNADMQQALLGGHVMAQSDATGWDQFVDAGKMRLLVTFGEQRTTRWPDVPTARSWATGSCRPRPTAAGPGHGPGVVRTLHDASSARCTTRPAWR